MIIHRWRIICSFNLLLIALIASGLSDQTVYAQGFGTMSFGGRAGFCPDTPINRGSCSVPVNGERVDPSNITNVEYSIQATEAGMEINFDSNGRVSGSIKLTYMKDTFNSVSSIPFCQSRLELNYTFTGRIKDEFSFRGIEGIMVPSFSGSYDLITNVIELDPDRPFPCQAPINPISGTFTAYVTNQRGFSVPGTTGLEDYFILMYRTGTDGKMDDPPMDFAPVGANLSEGKLGQNLMAAFFGGGAPPPVDDDPVRTNRPRIDLVTLPPTLTLGVRTPYEVDFTDEDADLSSLSVALVLENGLDGSRQVLKENSFSASSRGAAGKRSGTIPVEVVCLKDFGDVPAGISIILEYKLRDQAGNTSEPYKVSYNCKEGSVTPSPGSGMTSFWTDMFQSNSMGMIKIYQEEANKLGGTFRDGAGMLFGELSSDGSTFSGEWFQGPTYSQPNDAGTFTLTKSSDGSSISGTWRSGSSTTSVTATKANSTTFSQPPSSGPVTGVAPRIDNITMPNTITVGVPFSISIQFTDNDANINLVRVENNRTGTWELESAFDPNVMGTSSGTIEAELVCPIAISFLARITLFDLTGGSSGASELQVDCIGQTIAPIQPPSDDPPPSRQTSNNGGLTQFDDDNDCVMSDFEFFSATDAWIREQISNDLFFLAVDAWIGQTDICVAASAGVNVLKIESIKHSQGIAGTVYFDVRGQGIDSTQLQVFGLDGRVIYDSGLVGGNKLHWNLRMLNGARIANGVFLFRMTVKGVNGAILHSELYKLVSLQ